jgi:hypothetical protein
LLDRDQKSEAKPRSYYQRIPARMRIAAVMDTILRNRPATTVIVAQDKETRFIVSVNDINFQIQSSGWRG